MDTIKYIIEQLQLFGGKFLFLVFSIMGVAGVAASMGEEEAKRYTKGQKFLMHFTGGSFALCTGAGLTNSGIAPAFIGLICYFVGLYSNGFVKHSLNNQAALFNKLFTAIYTILDIFIDKFKRKIDPTDSSEEPIE